MNGAKKMRVDVGVALIVITCSLLFVFHRGFRKFALIAAGAAAGIAALVSLDGSLLLSKVTPVIIPRPLL
jgi:hypothetical protein